MIITDDHSLLGHQALGCELTAKERELANAMLKAFGSGEHDFAAIARLLEQWKVPRPSGDPGPWSVETLSRSCIRLTLRSTKPMPVTDLERDRTHVGQGPKRVSDG